MIELRVPLSSKMKAIQSGLMECLHQMLLELKRIHPNIDVDQLKLEHSFSKSFDFFIRTQLETVWQKVRLFVTETL